MPGVIAFVDGHPQLIGKEEHKQPYGAGEHQAQGKELPGGAADGLPILLHLGGGQLRHDQLRHGGHDAGGKENNGKHHALYGTVA